MADAITTAGIPILKQKDLPDTFLQKFFVLFRRLERVMLT